MAQQYHPRTLTITPNPGLFTKDLQVQDAASGTPLYQIKGYRSDQWTLLNLNNNFAAAQANFHGYFRAEVFFPGRPPISLQLTGGFFNNGYTFPSVGGGSLKWSGGDSKRTLTTQQGGQWIAKWDKAFLGNKATLELVDGIGGVALDEIVATGVAVSEIIRRRKNAGNN